MNNDIINDVISILCYLILLLHYILEANIVFFTPLHLYYSFSYNTLQIQIDNTQYKPTNNVAADNKVVEISSTFTSCNISDANASIFKTQ